MLLGGGGGGGCLSLLAAPPPLPCTSPLAAAPPLLLGFASALSDLALLPLDGFGTGAAAELRLQLDHAGADGVALAAGLVALGPLGPLGDHAVDRWGGGGEERNRLVRLLRCRPVIKKQAGWFGELRNGVCLVPE